MENMENLNTNMLIALGVGALILVLIIFGVTNSVKKNKRIKQLDDFQDRISTLKALPVQYLLNKVSLMPKTPDVEDQFEGWNDSYNRLTNDQASVIKKELIDIEQLVYARKFSASTARIKELETNIDAYENEYQALLNDLTKATQIDVKNRAEITNQKEAFRNYKKMYQSNSDNYKPYSMAIEKYFNNIEISFTNIDVLLNQSQVDKARNKAATLEGELLKMKDILNNLPAILDNLQRELPKEYDKTLAHYNEIAQLDYNISHLQVALRLDTIKKEIVSVLKNHDDIFLKDLLDVTENSYAELEAINKELVSEVEANKILNFEIEKLLNVEVEAKNKVTQANEQLSQIKHLYILTKNEEANLLMETQLLREFSATKNEIIQAKESNNYIASELVIKVEDLHPKFSALIIATSAYIKHIEKLREDEKRLYAEYANMQYIINETQAKLREMNLPKLSKAYYDTIDQCKKGLKEILVLLNEKPLNINASNFAVSKQHDIVYKLYDNSRSVVKTAQMAENTIVFGNRYRSSRPEVDTLLHKAETHFNNGQYSKSLSSAVEAIETVYPKVREELLTYGNEKSQGIAFN